MNDTGVHASNTTYAMKSILTLIKLIHGSVVNTMTREHEKMQTSEDDVSWVWDGNKTAT